MKRRRQLLGLWVYTIGTMGAAWGAAPLEDLAQRLQSADHVLLMRHAVAPGVGDPPGYNLQRCETQRNLNEQGRQQANRAGRWLRAQGVSQAQVYSSVWCRCQHTAEGLQLGPVRIEPSLNSFFDQSHRAPEQNLQLQVFIAQALKQKGTQPLILVTHQVNISALVGEYVGTADMVLVRFDPQGKVLSHHRLRSP